jgi:hypothetical protein
VSSDFNFNLFIEKLVIKRSSKINVKKLKDTLKISEYQIKELEAGNIRFMVYPYNYYITKQYIELVDKSEVINIKLSYFQYEKNATQKELDSEKKSSLNKIKKIINFDLWMKKNS